MPDRFFIAILISIATLLPLSSRGQTGAASSQGTPPPRIYAKFVYHDSTDRVILFDGLRRHSTTELSLRDVWAYDLRIAQWEERGPTFGDYGNQAVSSAAYDQQSNRIIAMSDRAETWSFHFESDTWRNMSPDSVPHARFGEGMAYDAESDRMILFGGFAGVPGNATHLDDTWAYDYDSNTWTRMQPAESPPGRSFFAVAYDSISDRVVIWGGRQAPLNGDNAIWAYDFNSDTWTRYDNVGGPGEVLAYPAMVYRPASGDMLLYGGAGLQAEFQGTVENGTWTYDLRGNSWKRLTPQHSPPAMAIHTMACDPFRGAVILAGGEMVQMYSNTISGETWTYVSALNDWLRNIGGTNIMLASPPRLEFGTMVVGGTSDTVMCTIYNSVDSVDLSISSISRSNSSFTVLDVPVLPTSLPSSDSLALRVFFEPDGAGAVNDSIVVESSGVIDHTFAVELSGRGLAITNPAQVGVIYTVAAGDPSGQLITLSTQTGDSTLISSFGLPLIGGLAVQRGTGKLYGVVASDSSTLLYHIDPVTGEAGLFKRIPIADMRAITFGDGDHLYGGSKAGTLYRIDISSGDIEQLGTSSGIPYNAFALSPTTGKLWASAIADPDTSDTLYTINTETGLATRVGSTGMMIRSSLAFDSSGALYGLTGGLETFNVLMAIDTQTGLGTPIGANLFQALCAITMRVDALVGVESTVILGPRTYSLSQNYPNPFNPSTTIEFALPHAGVVTLEVYNVLGEQVGTLVAGDHAAGTFKAAWDAGGFASGVYFYRLRAGDYVATRKMLLVK
jgi:hypothetical protein